MPSEIIIREKRTNTEMGFAQSDGEKDLTLAEKLDEFVIRLGYSNAHVLSIIVQLLTQGKIKIEFRAYIERLELVDPEDRISRGAAVTLVDDYIAKIQGKTNANESMNVTQKIIIQSPKRIN
jgi:hypothetical protein